MKRLTLAALLVLAAVSLTAGTTYEFRADTSGLQQMSIDGTVAVDGPNLKMTVSHGDGMMFKNGATVLSRDGGKTISVFDPAARTYYEMRVEAMMSSLTDGLHNAMVKLTFDHPSVTVKEGGDGGTVEGFLTQRVLLDASITVNMEAMGQTMSSKMSMHSESWTTDKIDASAMNLFQQRGGLTGIEGLDKLIAAQTAGLKGRFPLKQVTTVHIIQNGHDLATTTTSTVSKVKQQALDAAAFAAPAGYAKVDSPMEAMKKLGR